jgi:hypothetical protein
MIHFDQETHDPEGRFLPDEPVQRAPSDKQVAWVTPPANGSTVGSGALMLPASGSFWFKPLKREDACLLDVAGGSAEADRIALLFENGELVLRVWDGTGDHNGTSELEAGEARYAFDAGQDAPGLPLDVWNHIAFDVRGTRPDQLTLLVNGKTHGVRRFGLTRLAVAIDMSTTHIQVESVVGFPTRGVARIGDELVEYVLGTGNVLDATPIVAGAYAGFGGRLARERTTIVNNTRVPEILFGGGATGQPPANVGNHDAGTLVEIFGYSMPLRSDVPNGSSPLQAQLGAFTVGKVSRAVTQNSAAAGELIQVQIPGGGTINLGFGLDGAPTTATALELAPADSQTSQAQLMAAFSPAGGWALLVQRNMSQLQQDPQPNQPPPPPVNEPHTPHNVRIGGAEFVWYTGVQGNQLLFDPNKRGNATGFQHPGIIGREQRAFVVDFRNDLTVDAPGGTGGGGGSPPPQVDPDTLLDWEVFVFPISLGAPGATSHFLDPLTSQPPLQVQGQGGQAAQKIVSEYAQITETQQAELTEWVRYDEIGFGDQLVRNDDQALDQGFEALTHTNYQATNGARVPPQPGGGGPGAPGGGPGGAGPGGISPGGGGFADMLAPPSAPAQSSQQTTGSYWSEEAGAPEALEGPITRSLRTRLQFRGVFGTYAHAHAVNTPVLPVARIRRRVGGQPDAGRPGVDDPVFFVEQDPQLLGNPARVQRAYLPNAYEIHTWKQTTPGQMVPSDDATAYVYFAGSPNPVDLECAYVGLREPLPVPYPFDPIAAGTIQATSLPDIRQRYRMTKHPSGERPRVVSELRIGGSLVQSTSGAIPSALVDEICFGGATFAANAPGLVPESGQGAQLWLATELSQTANDFVLAPKTIRLADDIHGANYEFLQEFPEDAGLLQIGDEILCYSARTTDTGEIVIATLGRGLLGTRPEPHHAHEGAQFLEDFPVSLLDGDLSVSASDVRIVSTQDFPSEGLVLIDDELIHYTHLEGNTLAMPRSSSKPGLQDRKGGPLFRGRFGTTPAGHSTGTPVILFPFRFWDRWAPRADAPELAHFDLGLDQPGAWWESCFFFKHEFQGVRIGVLERDDPEAPWDCDPETDKRFALYWDGDVDGAPHKIGKQSDGLRWRVFVEYNPDAFDPLASTRYGWRQTPRLERLGAFYFAPEVVLRSVER